MSSFAVSKISPKDSTANKMVDALLTEEGIRRDANLDYMCGIFDDDGQLIATGSYFGNTIRCCAVKSSHRGEGLLNTVVTHLLDKLMAIGKQRVFVYTKCATARAFQDLGFYEIARIPNEVVFMENTKNGFSRYIENIARTKQSGTRVAAIVMNANPFTRGHQYLVEKASKECDIVHLFIVSEDVSIFPFTTRKTLIKAGTAHLHNIVYHETEDYMISNATFPSYFQVDRESVIKGQALLDLSVFTRIAAALGITHRYVGHEPNSFVTNLYNETMKQVLPNAGMTCIEVPRIETEGNVISASTVRKAIQDDDMALLSKQLPETTVEFLASPESAPIIQAIKAAKNVIHY